MKNTVNVNLRNEVEHLKNSFENYKRRLDEIELWLNETRDEDYILERTIEKEEIKKQMRWVRAQLLGLVTKIGMIVDEDIKFEIPESYCGSSHRIGESRMPGRKNSR